MRLDDAVRDYLAHIRHEKGYAKRTLATYSSWANHFTNWLEETGHPNPDLVLFSTPTLRRYLYNLSERVRPRTVRSAFFPLRGLAKFLVEAGVLAADPMIGLSLPKRDAPVRRMVSDADILVLLAACDRLHHPRKIALYRMTVATLVYTGARAQETLNIRLEHIHEGQQMLTIHAGKGEKTGQLYPCSEWWDAYRAWMRVREIDTKHTYLLAVDRGRKLGVEGMYRMLDELAAIAGLEHAPRPHEFRRSLTVRMMQNGASIRELSATLRHSLLSTTLEYALELGGEARAMATLGSLNAPARTARDLPVEFPQPAPVAVPSKPSKADTIARRRRTPAR